MFVQLMKMFYFLVQCFSAMSSDVLLKFDMPGKDIFSLDYTMILCDKYDPLKMMPFNGLTYLL